MFVATDIKLDDSKISFRFRDATLTDKWPSAERCTTQWNGMQELRKMIKR